MDPKLWPHLGMNTSAIKVKYQESDLLYTFDTLGFLVPDPTRHCDGNRHDLKILPGRLSEDHMHPGHYALRTGLTHLIFVLYSD